MNSNKKTNNNNLQQVQAKVNYFLKNKIISSKQFLLSSNVGSILDYFQKNNSSTKFKLKKEYFYNNSKLDLNTPLINLIEFKKNSSSSTIESVEIFVELEQIKENFYNNHPLFNVLLQPKENNFGLYVYKIKEGILTLEQYQPQIIKKFELDKYNLKFSSYCNSPKHLYISGGKINNDISLNNFWIINNRKYSIILKKMPYKKSNHTMIYIYLDNKEYIFIAGGDDNLMTFYYDIKMDSFIIWANMNTINIKPSLFQFKEYIYSFNSFNSDSNDGIYFERTNLVNGKPAWEKIVPKYDINKINYLNFKNNFFGISNGSNDEIIFCGGENSDINIFTYNPVDNILSIKEQSNNIKVKLSNKIFYDVNKEHSVALPSNLSEEKKIVILNKTKLKLRLINLENYDEMKKVKLKDDFDEEKESKGEIIIKAKIHERLRFEYQPQIVEAEKLSFENKGDINFKEKEIINMEFVPELNRENDLSYNKNREKREKDKFYLSNDVVYNNFVNLFVAKIKEKK